MSKHLDFPSSFWYPDPGYSFKECLPPSTDGESPSKSYHIISYHLKACCCYILYKSPFVLKSDLNLGQIGVWLPTPPHVPISHTTNFGIWSEPPPTFWDNVLKYIFFKASLTHSLSADSCTVRCLKEMIACVKLSHCFERWSRLLMGKMIKIVWSELGKYSEKEGELF